MNGRRSAANSTKAAKPACGCRRPRCMPPAPTDTPMPTGSPGKIPRDASLRAAEPALVRRGQGIRRQVSRDGDHRDPGVSRTPRRPGCSHAARPPARGHQRADPGHPVRGGARRRPDPQRGRAGAHGPGATGRVPEPVGNRTTAGASPPWRVSAVAGDALAAKDAASHCGSERVEWQGGHAGCQRERHGPWMNHDPGPTALPRFSPELQDAISHRGSGRGRELRLDRDEHRAGVHHEIDLRTGGGSPEVYVGDPVPQCASVFTTSMRTAVSKIAPPMGPAAACSGSFNPKTAQRKSRRSSSTLPLCQYMDETVTPESLVLRASQDRRPMSTVERPLGRAEIEVRAKATRRFHPRLQAEDRSGG